MTEPNECLLELRDCEAVLRWTGGELCVTLNIVCDRRAQVSLIAAGVPITDSLLAFREFFGPRQLLSHECSLEVKSASGRSVHSDHVWMSGWNLGSGAAELRLDCSELWVRTPSTSRQPRREYEYSVRGLLCHGWVTAEFDFGKVCVGGASKDDGDLINGKIVVTPREGATEDEIDAGASRVLDVLSFAIGRPLRWTVRERLIGDSVESRIWPHGDLPAAKWAPFYHLDLTPIITIAARTYTEAVRSSTGVGVAIHWALAHSAFESVRFVQLMVALEHMIQVAGSRVALFPKPMFDDLRGRLQEVVDDFKKTMAGETHAAECDAVRDSIAHLNNRAFKKQIRLLLGIYRVPLNGLDDHIDALVNLRNALVHRGEEPPETARQVIEHETILRELITRTVLAILGFEGTYRSWLDGPTDVAFARTVDNTLPPSNDAASA